jgi:4'-phosphopantetheinyl transferase
MSPGGRRPPQVQSGAMSDRPIDVWAVNLAGAAPFEGLADASLSEDERARADRFLFPSLRTDFVLARGLLRALLARSCGAAPAEVRFTYGPQGKPALANDPRIRFNLSHSGGVAVYAIARDLDLGVDVEQHRPMPDLESIARRFFSPREQADLIALPPGLRHAGFFDCWVRKEAYIKALGLGLSLPLDRFSVSVAPDQAPSLLEVAGAPGEPREWTLAAFSPRPGYHAALAIRVPSAAMVLHTVPAGDLLGGTHAVGP